MDQLRKLLSSLTLRQRVTLVVTAALVGLGIWAATRWQREQGFEPLYTALAPEDGAAVVQKLRELGIEHRLDAGGSTIKVRQERVAEARLQIAGSGLPKTGRLGFELFDNANFGLTEFAEQVNYRRAVEGELERTVMALAEVERARIHISMPKDSVFLETRQEAKASVMVKLRPRARLSPQNTAAICHLVASAVERLSPESVTVIDTEGRLLVKPRRGAADGGSAGPEIGLEYRQQVEKDLLAKIHQTLEPLLGTDNFRAGVSVELDLAATEQSEETYDPNKAAVQNSQKTEDLSGAPQNAGVPGTASNLPRPPVRAAVAGTGVSRKTENLTYQTSRVVKHTRLPQGSLRRMSLAVLVGQTVRWQGSGPKAKRVIEPPPPETLKKISDLVAAATGLSKERGDQLTVESLPFESALHSDPPLEGGPPPAGRPLSPLEQLLEKIPTPLRIGLGVAALLVLLAPVVWLVVRSRKSTGGAAVRTPVELPAGAAARVLPSEHHAPSLKEVVAAREAERERLENEALEVLKLPPLETKKAEVLAKFIKDQAKTDPTATAQMLISWIHEQER